MISHNDLQDVPVDPLRPRDTVVNPLRPASSAGEPQRHKATERSGAEHTELSVTTSHTLYDALPTLHSLQQSVDATYKHDTRGGGRGGGGATGQNVSASQYTLGSPRKINHRMGRIRRVTHGATPPSWFQPICIVFLGMLFVLAGLVLTGLGFGVKDLSGTVQTFMKVAGPIFLCLGVLSVAGGYCFFTVVFGRHKGGNRKDENIPPPDPAKESAHWGDRRRHPRRDEQAVKLFQANRAGGGTQNGTADGGRGRDEREGVGTRGMGEDAAIPRELARVKREGGGAERLPPLRPPGQARTEEPSLTSGSRQKNNVMDHLPRIPSVSGRSGRLPPLTPTLPDASREVVRNSSRKKKKSNKEQDGYKWKEEDFEPMVSTPRDPALFVVGKT